MLKKIIYYRRQGLEFSHISEMNFTFITSLAFLTFKHYIEQLTPMVERLGDRNLYKNYERIKSINDIGLTVNKGLYENGKVDVHVSSDEDE